MLNNRLAGAIGLTLAIITGIAFGLGVLLWYWNLVDWINMRFVRAFEAPANGEFQDGSPIVYSGIVRSEQPALQAPITSRPCAAYTFRISVSRSESDRNRRLRTDLALGFHLNRTTIESPTGSLRLLSLPGFETELRKTELDEKFSLSEDGPVVGIDAAARAHYDRLRDKVAYPAQATQEAELLAAQNSIIEEVHQDFCKSGELAKGARIGIAEEVLPIDTQVTVIGTYDAQQQALISRVSRLGPNLMVYIGSREQVLERVGREVAGWAKWVRAMVGLSVAMVVIVLLPDNIATQVPWVGGLILPWQ
ncbi:MAG: hypothetical protein AAF420_07605 [Pseudomonadota bacterium]